MPEITCMIPCYNAEGYCEQVIRDTLPFCTRLILINDGSTDRTIETLNRFTKDLPDKIKLISFKMNQGKGCALLAGYEEALKRPFDALISLDADMQHIPNEIPHIASAIFSGADLAIGTRNFHEMPFRSKFSNLIITKLLSFVYPNCPKDTQSGFRGTSPIFTEKIIEKVEKGRYETEFQILLLALKEKLKIVSVPISTVYQHKQRSYFNKISDSIRILKVLLLHKKEGR